MKLQTQIKLKKEKPQIDYSSKVLFLGSCFSENIGELFQYYKFNALVNPFGVLFHPVAIEKLFKRAIEERYFTSEDAFFLNERWHCFDVHSQFSTPDKDQIIADLNTQLLALKKWIKEGTHFVFTFGTAWVYRHIKTDAVVANCHKVPQPQFLKELLSPDNVSDVLLSIEQLIKAENPEAIIINTVSPVRHIKDGITGNARSKSHLLAGLLEITAPEKNNHYFPSYEIMMDELRDYRFYKEDLIHPNNTAISIIWDKFNSVWIASETLRLQKKIAEIHSGLLHKPFNANSEAHKKFTEKLQQKISEVKTALPRVSFD